MRLSIIPSVVSGSRVLGRLRVVVFAALLGLTVAISVPGPVAAWSANSYSPSDEQLLFNLTNQARASAGLPALRNDSYLVGLARWCSKDMIVRNYFSHQIPPSGEMVFAQMQRDGYCFQVAGENIGISSYPDDVATTRIQTAFMNSPSHRANILGVAWKNMGVGTYKGSDGKKTWTVLFSQPCGTTPAPTPKPTVKPTPKPTPKPVVKATLRPVVKATVPPTPTPTSKPTAKTTPTATASATPTPTLAPTPEPSVKPEPSASPTAADALPTEETALSPSGSTVSLRVRQAPPSEGLLDGLFRTLFGGLLGL